MEHAPETLYKDNSTAANYIQPGYGRPTRATLSRRPTQKKGCQDTLPGGEMDHATGPPAPSPHRPLAPRKELGGDEGRSVLGDRDSSIGLAREDATNTHVRKPTRRPGEEETMQWVLRASARKF